jgi:hypothetical protein
MKKAALPQLCTRSFNSPFQQIKMMQRGGDKGGADFFAGHEFRNYLRTSNKGSHVAYPTWL